jgi:hypothetical protein
MGSCDRQASEELTKGGEFEDEQDSNDTFRFCGLMSLAVHVERLGPRSDRILLSDKDLVGRRRLAPQL